MNDMYLGEDVAARRYLPIMHLRGSAIDSDEDSVEEIVEDMEMEAEVVEEEYFEEDDNSLERAEKCDRGPPGMAFAPPRTKCLSLR